MAKFKKVTLQNYFQENVDVVTIQTDKGRYRITEKDGGLKISLLADDGDDNIVLMPKATNMVIVNKM